MKSMRLFIDTNIILDWLQHREPEDNSSERIMEACIFGNVDGFLSVHSLTNLFYILRKDMDSDKRMKLMDYLCRHFSIVTETGGMVKSVIDRRNWDDIEDGLQMQCAIEEGVDYIITRNTDDYTASEVPVLEPQDYCRKYMD